MIKKCASFMFFLMCSYAASAEQGSWSYALQPTVMSGEMQPEASLASDDYLPLPARNNKSNIGYLSVRREPTNNYFVKFSLENRQVPICAPSGCTIAISFDGGDVVAFRASQSEEMYRGRAHPFPEILLLQDSAGFMSKAARAKKIAVRFESKDNGSSTLHFSASTPLKFPANIK